MDKDPADRIGRLRADAKPVLNPFFLEIDLQFGVFVDRVILPEFLDHLAVARPTAVDSRQSIGRTMASSHAFQPKLYHPFFSILNEPAAHLACRQPAVSGFVLIVFQQSGFST